MTLIPPVQASDSVPPRITMEELGLDPNAPLGRLSNQTGGRKAQPKEPIKRADGTYVARFFHPRTGTPTQRIVENENDARAISKSMFDLWIENGKPQATASAPKKKTTKNVKAQAPTPTPTPAPDFDPLLKQLFGKDLHVTQIGYSASNEPIIGLRNGSKETFIVKLVERTTI